MKFILVLLFTSTLFGACNTNDEVATNGDDTLPITREMASVVSVTTSGMENSYTFAVGISSPDTGCNQYADWWEVITEDGNLLYRRILAHSHVNEQPFVRSGGTVTIASNQNVIIRAHMNTSGYGTTAFTGTVATGFTATTLADNFAQNLATTAPLPNGCAF